MKRLGILLFIASLAGGAFAQDLDTVLVSDQYNVGGSRGNLKGTHKLTDDPATPDVDESETDVFGATKPDGTEYADYSGPDVTTTVNGTAITTSIRYINTWAGYNETGSWAETPVQTVTSPMSNHDRKLTGNIPAVPANPNPTATGGNTGILVADDGGYNALFFGESDDKNYFIEVDMFCPQTNVPVGYQESGVVLRAARDDGPAQPDRNDYTYAPYHDGSYSIFFEYGTGEALAVVYSTSGSPNTVGTIPNVTHGWHTVRIEAVGDQITYYWDGQQVAQIMDSTVIEGRPGYYYVEEGVLAGEEQQGLFDNMHAGPASLSAVSDWNLY